MSEPLISIVSPVFTIAGEVSADLGRDCLQLEIAETTAGLRTLRATFVAVGPGATGPQGRMLHLDGQLIDFGKTLSVTLGPDGAQRIVFDGVISGLEANYGDSEPPVVVVYAEDALMRLRMTRRMRTYLNVTDAQAAGEIAEAHQLSYTPELKGPQYQVLQQVNQSDLAFLRERARLLQAEVWCTGQTLHFTSRAQRRGTKLRLIQGNELLSVRLRADLAHQRSAVLVSGYDEVAATVINSRVGSEAIMAEVAQGRTGPDVVKRALGVATSVRVREVPHTSAEADAWANAEMLRRARAFVTVSGVTRGSPDLLVGSQLELIDVAQPFEGQGYYVTGFRHRFDVNVGLRTQFEAERATVNEATR